jgi:hypothetical protein
MAELLLMGRRLTGTAAVACSMFERRLGQPPLSQTAYPEFG